MKGGGPQDLRVSRRKAAACKSGSASWHAKGDDQKSLRRAIQLCIFPAPRCPSTLSLPTEDGETGAERRGQRRVEQRRVEQRTEEQSMEERPATGCSQPRSQPRCIKLNRFA